MFIYKKIHNIKMGNLLVLATKEIYKDAMTFMTNSLKKSIPFVIKAIPEIKIEGKWLSEHTYNCIASFYKVLGLMYVQLFHIIAQPMI